MEMADFYAKAGELLLVIHEVSGTAPQREFAVRFDYECGTARFDGRTWTDMRIYSKDEQVRIDRDRAEMG